MLYDILVLLLCIVVSAVVFAAFSTIYVGIRIKRRNKKDIEFIEWLTED